jgi:hypothetical protein
MPGKTPVPSIAASRDYMKFVENEIITCRNNPNSKQCEEAKKKVKAHIDEVYGTKGSSGKKSKKLFDKIDTNKSGTISLKEFTKYCKKKGMGAKKSKKLFNKYDKNGDKKLSRAEFSKIKFKRSMTSKKH